MHRAIKSPGPKPWDDRGSFYLPTQLAPNHRDPFGRVARFGRRTRVHRRVLLGVLGSATLIAGERPRLGKMANECADFRVPGAVHRRDRTAELPVRTRDLSGTVIQPIILLIVT